MTTTSSYQNYDRTLNTETQNLLATTTTIPMANTEFENNPYQPVDDQPDNLERILIAFAYFIIVITFPFSIFIWINTIQPYERAVVFRSGRVVSGRAKGPGRLFTLPYMDLVRKIDIRTSTFNVSPQEILTRDSVTIKVDAVVYSRVFDPVASVTNVKDSDNATKLLAQTTLRNILGTKSLYEILTDREAIAHTMQIHLDEGTGPWGTKVERVEIKDVQLPESMQRSMAAEAEASRGANAKVIAAEGEHKASRRLKEAADVIAESPIALQLRYLQTIGQIAAEKNSHITFPISVPSPNLTNHAM